MTINILHKYQITEEIYKNNEISVFRAIRYLDKVSVIIKILNTSLAKHEQVCQLYSEHEITKNLNIEGVIKIYDIEKFEDDIALIKEDFSGISLKEIFLKVNLSIIDFLKIAIQLSKTINELHKSKIIHNKINPFNIIINPANYLVKITDFSIATTFQRQVVRPDQYLNLKRNIDYLSPEQTGRMNRDVDYRTDFYSLGITLYEALTGQLPFQSTDPIQIIYSHLTRYPVLPSQLNSNIPEAVSLIIMKLLAKQAEDRYFSALGIQSDLEICLNQLQQMGTIVNFVPGKLDHASQFLIPQKLYGRSQEINTLFKAFERVCLGRSEILMVSGYTGVGKTSLINEIHGSVLNRKGYFMYGNFEKLSCNIPYFGWTKAIKELIRTILTYSSIEIELWKERITLALGSNTSVIIDLIPEIELIIGPQALAPTLNLKEPQNRLIQVFKKFIEIFTQEGHPLVIFLDDLQWSDSDSLELIEKLLADVHSKYLFFIGAYRNHEIDMDHLLIKIINNCQSLNFNFSEINLKSLKISDVKDFVCETLHCEPSISNPLAELVFYRTDGNPFYINHLLHTLYSENLINYNFEQKRWQYNLNQIKNKNFLDDDIINLLIKNIQKLSSKTQNILKLAACIGNEFTLFQLMLIKNESHLEILSYLWPALQSGIVILQNKLNYLGEQYYSSQSNLEQPNLVQRCYKFLDNRVQQAVYNLISPEQRKRRHLQIGQLLLKQISNNNIENNVFTLVYQFNNGIELIFDESFKIYLAELNFIAGKKSKLSGAYKISQRYLNIGIKLLPESIWKTHYDLVFNLYLELLEIEYLNNKFRDAEKYSNIIEINAKDIFDIIKIYKLRISYYFTQNQPDLALKTALNILKLIGVNFSQDTKILHIFIGFIKVKLLEVMVKNFSFLKLPPMRDPNKVAAMEIIMSVVPSVFVSQPNLFLTMIFRMIEYSIKYGNVSSSSFAYACYGNIHISMLGNISKGYYYSQIALNLLEKIDNIELKVKINLIFNVFNRHWKDHIQESILSLPDGIKYGIDSGDIENAGHCAAFYCSYLFLSGENLESVINKHDFYINFLESYNQTFDLIHLKIWHQMTLLLLDNLNEDIIKKLELNDILIANLNENNVLIVSFYLTKIIISFFLRNDIIFIEYFDRSNKYINQVKGLLYFSFYIFYCCLGIIRLYSSATKSNKRKYLKKIKYFRKKLKFWALNCPKNYQNKYDLVEAEVARIFGKDIISMNLYDRSILGAREHKYLQEEALANELAGEFYLSRGRDKIAKTYLMDAYDAYSRWGALAKLKDLELRYPSIFSKKYLPDILNSNVNSKRNQDSLNLDFLTIYKSSQAISEEIVLEKLIDKLVNILMYHAGAQNAFLVLSRNQKLVVEASISVDRNSSDFYQLIIDDDTNILPVSIINYVARTQNNLALQDAIKDSVFSKDIYIKNKNPKSILCMPLLNQGKFIGLIYLENNIACGSFRDDHLEVLKLLCSQAAISIENAKLYKDLTETKAREQAERELNELKSRFISIASHEFRTPLTTILGTSELIKYYSKNWPPEKTEAYLDRICSNVKDIVSLLDEVLFLSKGEAGKIDFQAEPTELVEFCQGLVHETQLAAEAGQKIDFSFSDQGSNVYVDRKLLKHILRNLLSNAIKYSFSDSVVIFKLKLADNKAIFIIQDQGIGIPAEDQDQLFRSFHRASNVGDLSGSGLGLSIVKQCVELHGGTISFTSKVDVGTTFTVMIPLTR